MNGPISKCKEYPKIGLRNSIQFFWISTFGAICGKGKAHNKIVSDAMFLWQPQSLYAMFI